MKKSFLACALILCAFKFAFAKFQARRALSFVSVTFALVLSISLAACSDGSSTSASDNLGLSSSSKKSVSSSSNGILSSGSVRIDISTITACTIKTFNYFVADEDGFKQVRNICADNTAGMTVYMTSTEQSYVCVYDYQTKEAYWTFASIKGPKVTKAIHCKTESSDNCEYDSIYDERDGQTYKTVVIGDQTWMAENLNFNDSIKVSECRSDDDVSCSKYGRFYFWSQVSSSKQFCPDGWRLPSEEDAAILLGATGGTTSKALKSTTGWYVSSLPSSDGNGTDIYGFNAEPLGFLDDSDLFNAEFSCSFWLSTAYRYGWGEGEELSIDITNALIQKSFSDSYQNNIRCIKDDSTTGVFLNIYLRDPGPLKTPDEFMNEKIKYGTLEDARDNKSYKTVVIGDQTWMAQNLNFETTTSDCYGGVADSCLKYGRLYTWGDAMIATCPSGWRLPSKEDWHTLLSKMSTDNYSEGFSHYYTNAANVLMGPKTWDYTNCGGTNAYGFTAMPSPASLEIKEPRETEHDAYFWSYTEENDALLLKSTCGADVVMIETSEKVLHPVRCIKDISAVDSTLYSE